MLFDLGSVQCVHIKVILKDQSALEPDLYLFPFKNVFAYVGGSSKSEK